MIWPFMPLHSAHKLFHHNQFMFEEYHILLFCFCGLISKDFGACFKNTCIVVVEKTYSIHFEGYLQLQTKKIVNSNGFEQNNIVLVVVVQCGFFKFLSNIRCFELDFHQSPTGELFRQIFLVLRSQGVVVNPKLQLRVWEGRG